MNNFVNPRYVEVYFYTLEDGFNYWSNSTIKDHSLGYPLGTNFLTVIKTAKNTSDTEIESLNYIQKVDNVVSLKNFVGDMLNQLGRKYYEHYIGTTEGDTATEKASMYRLFVMKLSAKIEETYPRYSQILKLYQDNIAKLLDGVKTTSSSSRTNTGTVSDSGSASNTHKENDTPQGSGDYSTDTYTSLITSDSNSNSNTRTDNLSEALQSLTTSDFNTVMGRLNEIQDSFESTMARWINEFSPLFIEGGMIENE